MRELTLGEQREYYTTFAVTARVTAPCGVVGVWTIDAVVRFSPNCLLLRPERILGLVMKLLHADRQESSYDTLQRVVGTDLMSTQDCSDLR